MSGKKKRDREYKCTNRLQESKRPLYGLAFNLTDARYKNVFASVGINRVTVYKCLPQGEVTVLQAYVDEDKDENFYTVCWSCDDFGCPMLAVSGSHGVIRIIDCSQFRLQKSFTGHGGSVNELRVQPQKPELLLSASKDESVRLWNIKTGVCVLILAGSAAHRNEVLSVDFHPSDMKKILSCGMDSSIKIWSLKDFWRYVEMSFTWDGLRTDFPTKYVQFPLLSAFDVHNNYVDCARWLGDLVLSKSVDNEIVLWKPPKVLGNGHSDGSVDVLQKYAVPECDIWFMKFSMDFHCTTLTIGNREGKIFVFEPQNSPLAITKLGTPQCKSPVRQTATSFDGSTILCCCEDGSIWRWDLSTASSKDE
ncbi:hypothetical protein CBR_g21046 [Chara braunii]|uniref:Uncharacterized protein n=1 Tax=Chara braunii TaxID=69332 RepID=A0A388L0J5_CHABU|nr:hypothetical protein CBR_g21046 [Chara braunii]|eukprot:GBG75801.1 hypothetical protein CBR_g21046 [Chara braunii]